ncbi:hypothetical protein [Conexibacter woesei]|uniref:Uncharacterized protein n=1 Tax=Conexibacter woesei (strain DSM 14684 / CCUG 47730 / CIP 108061 / JCM 11494 / NBRC 100937 / ID131577) TaxID=469383 RepID=D3F7P9_CONWI|nr:hypothetical protein [Conexibacter woesei]ADB50911.1 hypothetical protein Cwoe_2489 [Conexibacter woesei DSM 14684]
MLAAAALAAVLSGAPSTLDMLRRGGDPLASVRAAGALLVGADRSDGVLIAAAVPVHAALSLGWTAMLARTLPARHEPLRGAAVGLAIAALDLGLAAACGSRASRFAPVAALPQVSQWADHVTFGLTVGVMLRRARLRSAGASATFGNLHPL